MNTTMIRDNAGRESEMVAIHLSDFISKGLGNHPAFKVKGKTIETIYISKYPNTIIDGRAYSIKGAEPVTGIDFDDMREACERKGPGWHLMTNAEWAAVALWSKANGTIPRGNTAHGQSHSHPEEKGRLCKYGKTFAGSGPATWNHDHTEDGIADLCGNVWEWVGGLRFMDGQVQIIPDNDAAAGVDQGEHSAAWLPVKADGKPINYLVADGKITLTTEDIDETEWDGTQFSKLQSDIEVPELLKQLALYPDGYEGSDWCFIDTEGERLAYRGGGWSSGATGGVFSFNASGARSDANTSVGGRSAFVKYSEICDSDDLSDSTEDERDPVKLAEAWNRAGITVEQATEAVAELAKLAKKCHFFGDAEQQAEEVDHE